MHSTKPDAPRIRYTIGPDQLGFGPHDLKKGEWFGPVDNALAGEAVRPGHVAEYGFEQEGHVPPDAPAPAPGPANAAAPSRGPRTRAPAVADGAPTDNNLTPQE